MAADTSDNTNLPFDDLHARSPNIDPMKLLTERAPAAEIRQNKDYGLPELEIDIFDETRREIILKEAFQNFLNPEPDEPHLPEPPDYRQAKGPVWQEQREWSRSAFPAMEIRPVSDPEILKEVPNAVYIGVQGRRRDDDCKPVEQDYWLSRKAAEALYRAQTRLLQFGKDPVRLRNMNAAGRSETDKELIKKCAPKQIHAHRRSQHQDGISIDVENWQDKEVRIALAAEGFRRNVPGDEPHFTFFAPVKETETKQNRAPRRKNR